MNLPRYLLVESEAAPDAFRKVVEVKRLLSSGRARSVSEAAQLAGISRSAFYKYRDKVQPFNDMLSGNIITVSAMLRDEPGVLTRLTGILYESGANILAINQSIPVGGIAPVSVTVRVDNMTLSVEEMLNQIRRSDDVNNVEIISGLI
jgi:chorismate mutase